MPVLSNIPEGYEEIGLTGIQSGIPEGYEEIGYDTSAPVKPDEEPGALSTIGRGLTHGTIGLAESVGTGLQWAGERIENKSIARAGETASKYWGKIAEPFGLPESIAGKNVIDDPSLLADATYWLYNVPEMIPALGATILSSVAMPQITVAKNAPKIIASLAKLSKLFPAFVVGGGLEATQTYKQVLQSGASEESAARSAELMFLGSGALNAIGTGKILEAAGGGFKGRIIKTLGAGAWEGITEGLEEPTEVFSKYIGKYLAGERLPTDLKEQLLESLKAAATVAPIASVTGFGASTLGGTKAEPTDENVETFRKAVESGEFEKGIISGDITPDMVEDIAINIEEIDPSLADTIRNLSSEKPDITKPSKFEEIEIPEGYEEVIAEPSKLALENQKRIDAIAPEYLNPPETQELPAGFVKTPEGEIVQKGFYDEIIKGKIPPLTSKQERLLKKIAEEKSQEAARQLVKERPDLFNTKMSAPEIEEHLALPPGQGFELKPTTKLKKPPIQKSYEAEVSYKPIVSKSGKPFRSMAWANRVLKSKGLSPTEYTIIEHEGGYAIQRFGRKVKPIPTEPTAKIAREPVGVEKKAVAGEKVGKLSWEGKQGWEMTKNEIAEKYAFTEKVYYHEDAIRQALKEGKPVPKEVLAEYPDLVPAKPQPSKIEKPKPPEAITEEIKAKVIPEPRPKVEKEYYVPELDKVFKESEFTKVKTPMGTTWGLKELPDKAVAHISKESLAKPSPAIKPEAYEKARKAFGIEEKAEVTPEKKETAKIEEERFLYKQGLDDISVRMLEEANRKLDIDCKKTIEVARKIAKLEREKLSQEHIAEAIQYAARDYAIVEEVTKSKKEIVDDREVRILPNGQELDEYAAQRVEQVFDIKKPPKEIPEKPSKAKYTEEQRKVFAQYEGKIRVAKKVKDIKEAERLRKELNILKAKTVEKPTGVKAPEGKVFATKVVKSQDTITRADLKSIFAKMKNISTGVDKDGNFFFRPLGKSVVTIYTVNEIEGYIDTSKGQIPVGSFLGNTIELKTGGKGHTADTSTIFHEFEHWMEANGILSNNDIKALDTALEKQGITPNTETRAEYVGDRLSEWQSQKNLRIRRVFKKIADFVNSIWEFVSRTRTAKGVLADIETGKILSEKELSAVNQFAQDVSFSLKKAAKAITDNPNFVKWFGDSKVLNKDGSPMVVYHGTDKDFTIFREGAFDIGIHLGTAEQASDRLEFKAGEDITLPKQAILPLYARMENPLVLKSDPGLFDFANLPWALDRLGKFTKKEIDSLKNYESEDYRLEDEFTESQDLLFVRKELMDRFRQDIQSLLSKHGYDGIKYWNTGEIKGMAAIMRKLNAAESKTELSDIYEEKAQLEKTGGDWSYVAFESTHIKSIYNTGAFGLTEPDIMFATKSTKDYKAMLRKYQEAHTTPLVDETVDKTKIKHFYNLEKVSSQPAWVKEKFGREEKTLTEKIGDNVGAFRKNWQTRLLDRLHPIKALGETAYMLHRLETGAQATMAMFMRHGKLRWEGKALTIDTQKQGFMPWLDSLGDDAQKLFYWMAAKRAEVLETEGREKWLDTDTRKKIFDWVGDKPKSAKSWRILNSQFQGFNKSVLDLAQQSGLINPIKRATWEQEFYVPFYRIFEDAVAREEFLKGPLMGKKHISAQIKRLLGAEMKIGDPLENVIRNWSHLIHESVRNMARAEAYDYAQKNKIKSSMMGEGDKLMPLIETVKASDLNIYRSDKEKRMVYVTKKGDDNILSFQKNGRRVYFKVNDIEMFNALSDVNHRQFNGFLIRAFGQAKRWLTYGATFGPAFKVANMLRDSLHTAIISKSFIPFVDSGKGIVKALREDADYVKFMASGAGFGSSYIRAENPQALAEYINRIVKKEGKGATQRILDTPKKMLDFWEKLGAASENAARVQLYTKRIAEGETHLKAAFEGRDLMDFTMRGDSQVVQFLIRTVPFMNARAQGLYKLGRAAKQDPKSFMIKGSMLTMATLALWAINRDEDEWKELEDWDKRTYYHFWIGDKHYRIPKPFETGAIFSTIFEGMAEVMSSDEEFGYFVDVMKDTFLDTFAMNPIPQAVRPLIEQWSNKSFFTGRPIEGQSLQRLRPAERKTAWTSETMQLAGKLGVSPKRAEEIIRGYFSTFGMFLLGISDIFTYQLADFPVNPTKEIDDYPLLGRFIKERTPARHTKYQTEFYEIFREVDQLVATVNNYKKLGDYKKAVALSKKERKNFIKKKGLFTVRKQLTEINAKLRRIMSSRILTAEKKRAKVDQLIERKNRLTKQAYEIYARD